MKAVPVSVVIPTYNCGALLVQAVDSVLAQSAPPLEIVVVDDGSTDDTRSRLAPYGDKVRYLAQANQGVAAARNRGIQESRGEFVAFLDADDVWHPEKLAAQTAALAGRADIGLLATDFVDWPGEGWKELAGQVPAPVPTPWERLVVKNDLCTSSLLVRRSALEKVGEFDTSMQGPEDHDLWLRLAEVSVVATLPLPLAGYRWVPGSLSKQAARMEAGMRRVLEKVDEGKEWRGRWLLRRKAYSYCHYSCGYMHSVASNHGPALRNLVQSFLWYPLPFRREDVRTPLARPKLLIKAVLRGLRLADAVQGQVPISPEGGRSAQPVCPNA
jgi:glycosyltransferase involved in cell wall biosynthesis